MVARFAKILILWASLLSPSGAWAGSPPPPSRPSAPTGVFHSVAFPVASFPAMREWKAVRPFVEQADFHCVRGTDCKGREIVRRALEGVLSADLSRKLAVINRAVNGLVRYVPDNLGKSSPDAWSSPDETLARGSGDCEDYAILKMAALKEAGVPMTSMSVVVLRDTRRNLYHAVLAVSTDEGYLILDNLRDNVSSDRDLDNYMPLYSVGISGGWVHGSRPPRDSAGAS